MIEQEQFLCITKNVVVPRQKFGRDRHCAMLGNPRTGKVSCGTPWQMVAPELRLTHKVTADKRRSGTPIAKDCG